MEVGERIKKLRENKKLSTTDLSRLTGISQSTISKLENGKRKPELATLEKIAEALNIFVNKLSGESASSIIEDRLEEMGKTLPELAEVSKVPLTFLQNLDEIIPGSEDDGAQYYGYMTMIAKALRISPGSLRAALARQEIPVYDGPMQSTEETFKDVPFEENYTPTTIAAHHDGDEWTEEELADIKRFKEFVRSKRNAKS